MAADDVPGALAGDKRIEWERDAQATRFRSARSTSRPCQASPSRRGPPRASGRAIFVAA